MSPGLETGSLVKWITLMVVGSVGASVVFTGVVVVSTIWAAGSSNSGAGAGASPSNAEEN